MLRCVSRRQRRTWLAFGMGQKRFFRGYVAGLVVACSLVGTTSIAVQAQTVTPIAITPIPVATLPTYPYPMGSMVLDSAGAFAYVPHGLSNTISKINLNTNAVTTITLGKEAADIAINPAGTFAYVTTLNDGTIEKINLNTNTVTTINIGAMRPFRVALNPAGTFAYVTAVDAITMGSYLLKIDLATDTVTTMFGGPVDLRPLAFNPAGTFAYTQSNESNQVLKINLDTDFIDDAITAEPIPMYLAIHPAGTFVYTVNGDGPVQYISKINLSTKEVTKIRLGSGIGGIAINPAGTYAYLTIGSNTIAKLNLATDIVASVLDIGFNPRGLVFNPAGTFAYLLNEENSTISKIALTATEPQSITVPAISAQLSVKTVALSATASSTLAVTYASATPSVCTVSGSTVTVVTIGDCTINSNQSGGYGWDPAPQVSQTFKILVTVPTGEVGVSIKNGASYVNTKQVTLNLIWPEFATSARISNDGGFAASKIQTKDLTASIDWELDDSVQGTYTKVVYVRFNGVANTTQTYSDDIILDTSPPVVESSSAAAVSGFIDLTLKATDDITGVDKVQIKNGATTVTKDYAAKVSVPLADLMLSVSSMGVRKLASTSVEIRVSDKAGNWSAYAPLSVSSVAAAPTATTPTASTPTVSKSKSATAKSIAIFAKIPVLSTSKVSLKVVSGYTKFCKVSGTSLKGIKAGTCKVTVTVTPKKGKAIPKTVTLKVTN